MIHDSIIHVTALKPVFKRLNHGKIDNVKFAMLSMFASTAQSSVQFIYITEVHLQIFFLSPYRTETSTFYIYEFNLYKSLMEVKSQD